MLFKRDRARDADLPLPPVRQTGTQLVLDAHAASETGHRLVNEDSFLCIVDPASPAWLDGLFVVADGIGGRQNGQIASALAVRAVRDAILGTDRYFCASAPSELLQSAFSQANKAVVEAARGDAALFEMGTTLTVGLVAQRKFYVASLGDSRAYLQRGRRLIALTTDDWFQAPADATDETPDGVVTVVTQAIGWDEEPRPRLTDIEIGDGDMLLVCSDGLTCPVPDRQIEATASRFGKRPDIAVRKLLDQALTDPESDNVTIVLARVEGR